ncbi:MAG: type 2 isopentenyl-diphosphate Delta-isomerase [Candidatus Methanoperedens sp.]|nr:type 2 isopentenyl-diphosphate Delta-isomerase [Candidatus Methanoperedens sp.]MCZ7358658.1 type 2 isopentenyl-diphosphate Delta-isomerase [Candidatus Methanoperedens sp.]HLB69745.1 type 2 isopentenyl-diphosphate Delta-isomerase [Candidatus Methanoperedens sp.]
MTTSDRKIEHLLLCVEKDVEAHKTHFGLRASGFDDVDLVHNCLPELNKKSIDPEVEFFGKKLSAPLLIASMTGGHPDTRAVNASLAGAAEELGIGIGVGSQRAAIENPALEESFRIVRDKAPHAFIYGNVGAAQLNEFGIEGLERAVEMIGADAMAIHLNFLQEAIQPEGNIDATGCLDGIKKICRALSVPVIVKETGAGVAHFQAVAICEAGASAIDVGGLGGTSWAGVETYRAQKRGDLLSDHLGKQFWNWGIPTVASIVESSISIPVVATGGVRSGLDIAKSLALGASLCGIALPLVAPALKGQKDVSDKLNLIIEELKVSMFLSGCRTVYELGNAPAVITGKTKEFLEQRGFETGKYARRRYKV